MELGTLFWYNAGDPKVAMSELLTYAESIGMDIHRQILPVDVFRRVTGPKGSSARYTVGGDRTVTLRVIPGKDTDTMLRRVVTRVSTAREEDRIEVGDFVFYHPPRGEPERSRIRTTARKIDDLPDRTQVERFLQVLRDEYQRGLEFLDAQGVRRIVRAYLAANHAIPIGGTVYFVPHAEPVYQLRLLLDMVGHSEGFSAEIAEGPEHLDLVERALTAGIRRGKVPTETLETYARLLKKEVTGG